MRSTPARTAATTLLLLTACGTAPAARTPAAAASVTATSDWPTYGYDVTRSGTNLGETQLVKERAPALRPLWQAEIGMGRRASFSTPTVADGTVFLGSSVEEGDNFFAIDAATGMLLWSVDLGHRAGSCTGIGVASSAAVSAGVVVVGGGDGAYFGIDETAGTILWQHDLAAGPSGFAWTSPLILNGRAYVGVASECDNPSVPGELRALDLRSGALVARHPFSSGTVPGGGLWN